MNKDQKSGKASAGGAGPPSQNKGKAKAKARQKFKPSPAVATYQPAQRQQVHGYHIYNEIVNTNHLHRISRHLSLGSVLRLPIGMSAAAAAT